MGNDLSSEPQKIIAVIPSIPKPRVHFEPSEKSILDQFRIWEDVDRVVIITYLFQPGISLSKEQAAMALTTGQFLPGARAKQLEEKWKERGKPVHLHTAPDLTGISESLAKVTQKSRILIVGNIGVQSSFKAGSDHLTLVPIIQGIQGSNVSNDLADDLAERLSSAMANLPSTNPLKPLLISLYRDDSAHYFSVNLLKAFAKKNIYVGVRSVNIKDTKLPCGFYFYQSAIRQVLAQECP
jgi:hypothetical protein